MNILRCDCCHALRPCTVLVLQEWSYITYRCDECLVVPHALHEEAA